MALSGTLDTLSLPELCELLSGTNKTGALHVRSETGQGVLWFAGGKVCAGEAGGQTGPPAGAGGDLLERLHDVCFELFRYSEGSFDFEADRRPSWPAERSVDVSGLLAETERRMTEWREIIAVIPSVEARPRLVPEPPASGPITLDAAQWRVVTGVDGRRRVSALIRVLDGGEFSVCKVLKSLVQAGLVEIDAAEAPAAPAAGAGPAGAEPATQPVTQSASAATAASSGDGAGGRAAPKARDRSRVEVEQIADAEADAERGTGAEKLDPLADGLDRGAVVALLTSARSK
ncbi:MAG TPA: DUF4388 domain-containing protein [Acidimicrobiia bacterium]|nr:DUF4388 domain-containing protein [Acidimicrobiia bacterium]